MKSLVVNSQKWFQQSFLSGTSVAGMSSPHLLVQE